MEQMGFPIGRKYVERWGTNGYGTLKTRGTVGSRRPNETAVWRRTWRRVSRKQYGRTKKHSVDFEVLLLTE